MAKVISDEILRLKIVVNGDEAQKQVLDLERANNTLAIRLNDLKQKQADLSRQRKKDSEEYRQNVIEINKVSSAISDNNREIGKLVKEMDIASLTMTQLRSRAKELQFTMSHMNPNSKEYGLADAEMQKLNGRMTELKTGSNGAALSIKNLATKFNEYQGIIFAAGAVLTGLILSIQATIDLNNKMADAQTAVVKTTGLSKEAVDELTKSFSEFNTRTSRIDLLKIAEIGGRLGVPKEQIKDFTREVDKAYVALGDGFVGGVEAVANKLGKIKGLFKETKDLNIAVAINQIGSSLNELGAAGAATEENVSDFALRVGALPNALKPTIGEALGLGAAFEQSGIEAQRAGTAFTGFISTAALETGKFAKVMGISTDAAKKLINSNPTEFFLKFSESIKGMDATKLSATLDYLKLSDQYVKSIVGSASENVEGFRQSIALSNQSLVEATSLQEEFNKVNNNSAAIFEKVRKKFMGMFTSQTVAKTLNSIINLFGEFLGVTEETNTTVEVLKNVFFETSKVLLIVLTTLLSYKTGMILTELATNKSSIATKLFSYALKVAGIEMNTTRAATILLSAGKALLTGNITKARQAMALFNVTIKANPIGVLLAGLTLVVGAMIYFKNEADNARIAQKKLWEEQNRAATIIKQTYESGRVAQEKFRDSTRLLIDILKSEVATQDTRKKAYEALIKINPAFIDTVDKEFRATKKLADVYNVLALSIDIAARAKARAAARESIYGEIEKARIDYVKGEANRQKEQEERDNIRAQQTANQNNARKLISQGKTGEAENVLSKNFGPILFTENNKGTALIESINKNTALLSQLNAADSRRVDQIQKLLKTATGNKKQRLQQELNGYITSEIESSNVGGNVNDFTPPDDQKKAKSKIKSQSEKDSDSALKKYIAARDKILKSAEDFDQQELELAAKLEDAKAEIMQDGFNKEVKLILAEESKKLAELEKQKHSKENYAEIDNIISKEKGVLKKKFEDIKAEWLKQDGTYSELQLLETQKTNLKLASLNEKAAKEAVKKQEENFQKMIAKIKDEQNRAIAGNTTVEMQRALLASFGYSKESLRQIRTWEEGKSEIENYYQQKSLEAQVKYLQQKVAEFSAAVQLNPSLLSPDQLDQIDEYKVKINELLATITALKNGGSDKKDVFSSLSSFGSSGKTDILGLSPEQWEAMFTKTDDFKTNIQKIGAAIEVTQQLFAKYYEFVAANETRQLQQYELSNNRKKRSLKKQLDEGYINQETYKKLTLDADAELDRKKAELEYKAAKRQKEMAIVQAITSTALAIMGIWRDFPKVDFGITAAIMSGVVGALGAVQLATILAQPLPSVTGAEDGFYPVLRAQDGKRFNARKRISQTGIYSEPTMLVGEAGNNFPELVVSGKTMKRIDPQIQQVYMSEIRRVEGFENGLTPSSSSGSNNDQLMMQMMALLSKNVEVLTEIKDVGVRAYIEKSVRNGKDISEMQKDYEKLYNKNKY